jgi:hypothetical protein
METSSAVFEEDVLCFSEKLIMENDLIIKNLKMSLKQRLHLKIFGNFLFKEVQLDDWKNPMSVYVFECPVHGLQTSYPVGWRRKLICLRCLDDLKDSNQ